MGLEWLNSCSQDFRRLRDENIEALQVVVASGLLYHAELIFRIPSDLKSELRLQVPAAEFPECTVHTQPFPKLLSGQVIVALHRELLCDIYQVSQLLALGFCNHEESSHKDGGTADDTDLSAGCQSEA